jgi:hypothetical protein
MPKFTDEVEITRPWSDWMFLRQKRDVEGNGGFHVHNPYGDSNQPQGVPARNRLEIGYRTTGGQDLWGQLVLHGPTGRVGINNVDPQARVDVRNPWGDWLFLRQQRDQQGDGGFHIHNPWGNSNQPQGDASRNRLEIGYRTASGQDIWGQVVIHGPSGDVGIGTVTPGAKLDVAGDLHVSGNIRIKDWSLSVPDAVFDPEYELRTLKDLRAYIERDKHLPEVPSVTQVREEGVSVGDFCMVLLKKIEELTLYILHQQEQLVALEKRVQAGEGGSST